MEKQSDDGRGGSYRHPGSRLWVLAREAGIRAGAAADRADHCTAAGRLLERGTDAVARGADDAHLCQVAAIPTATGQLAYAG